MPRSRPGHRVASAAALALGAALSLAVVPAVGAAQARSQPTAPAPTRATQQRAELERVRRERAALEQRMREMQGTVHDLSAEVANLDRQADATARLVGTLGTQLSALDDEVQTTTTRLTRAQRDLDVKHVALRRRLVDIYKRGPLYTAEALLSAETFGELVTRYKYLHELALRDRALVRRVETLRDNVAAQHTLLVRLHSELERSRTEKADEERRLRQLQEQRSASLTQARRQVDRTRQRLAQMARDEARLTNVIASLEVARRRAESRPSARPAAPSTLKASESARLNWPVSGALLYRFGRVVSADNTTTRWNGIGIAAAAGTPVRAVAAGTVVLAEAMGSYGLTIIVQHGGGDYSVYGSLGRAEVAKGAAVAKGQTIGTVGSADAELPPHLHFEVRPDGRAVDPLTWLQAQR